MMSVVVVSLILPFGVFFAVYLRRLLRRYHPVLTPGRLSVLMAGAFLIVLAAALFGGAAAYYFDYDQNSDPLPWFQLSGFLLIVGSALYFRTERNLRRRRP